MADFSNLDKLAVAEKTARYEVDRVEGVDPKKPVVIIGRPATQDNKPFFNAYMKEMGSRSRTMRKGRLTPELMSAQRRVLKRLFPKFVFVGWENMPDVAGSEVPFSVENGEQFCAKIPEYMFDDMRDFFESEDSFLDEDEPRVNTEEVAGN